MAAITIRGASKGYGLISVLQNLDLDVRSGEFMVIVGPSGCGKSTLLRSICGLETLDTGQIRIGERDVTHVSPSDRGAAMVFQSYALYPHMTVAENMGFALRMEGLTKGEIATRVVRAAGILKLEDLLQRRPKELSGGQRQRVAIGRAIVRNPRVFLFDEPLSNLDAELRVQMRLELTALHRELGTTMIYVTHDQVEAMTMADRIVVMRKGVIEQIGAPTELYEKPANLFVAGFIGSPRMNFLKARLGPAQGDSVGVQLDEIGSTLHLPAVKTLGLSGPSATLGVRPEHIRLTRGGPGPRMTVQHIENLGPHQLVYLRTGHGEPITVQYQGDDRLEIGHEVTLAFAPDRALLFA